VAFGEKEQGKEQGHLVASTQVFLFRTFSSVLLLFLHLLLQIACKGFAEFAYLPTRRGFSSFFGYANGAIDYWTHDTNEWLVGRRTNPRVPTPGSLGHDWWRGEAPVPRAQVDGQHGSSLIARAAVAVVAAHGAEVRAARAASGGGSDDGGGGGSSGSGGGSDGPPLFLYVASQAPHLHFTGAPQDMYAAVDRAFAAAAGNAGVAAGLPWARREVGALVSCLDSLMGSIEDALVTEGLWGDALLLFASDNGPEGAPPGGSGGGGESVGGGSGSGGSGGSGGGVVASGASAHPLRGRKRTVWEGALRSVAFVHAPDLTRLGGGVGSGGAGFHCSDRVGVDGVGGVSGGGGGDCGRGGR